MLSSQCPGEQRDEGRRRIGTVLIGWSSQRERGREKDGGLKSEEWWESKIL